MDMNFLYHQISQKNWHSINGLYTPIVLAKNLSFKEGMFLAYSMLLNEEREDDIRDFATELLQEIRLAHPTDWLSDWRNEIFLGDACYITMKYDERYEAYRRAYKQTNTPPPFLLISLASCYLSPSRPITIDEAENLAKYALKKELSIEGVVLLRGIYAEKEDKANFEYWDKMLKEVEEKQIHSQNEWPNFSDIRFTTT